MPLALLAPAIGAFAIGTTEFVISGLLPELAGDLAVDIPTAGLLVTGYALGVVVGLGFGAPNLVGAAMAAGGLVLALISVVLDRGRAAVTVGQVAA